MAFFMKISKLFSKNEHSRALMSKNEVLYDQNHIRSFNKNPFWANLIVERQVFMSKYNFFVKQAFF